MAPNVAFFYACLFLWRVFQAASPLAGCLHPGATTLIHSPPIPKRGEHQQQKEGGRMTTYSEIYITETRRRIPEGGLTPFCEFMVCATVEEKGAIIGNVPLAGPFSNVESAEAVVSRMATAWIEAGN